MPDQPDYDQRLITETAENLRSALRATPATTQVKPIVLPEVDNVVEQVARITPAGDALGLILSGLARISGRRVNINNVRSDINTIFQTLDKAIYGTFFAGPAAVIWAYQHLLSLAGKDPEDAFPEGTWQFYVDYALREDTARHANETDGFDARLKYHQIELAPVDRMTAWVMAAITTIHQYPALLRNEWRERVYTYALRDVSKDLPNAYRFARAYREWEKQRPYRRGADAHEKESYPDYRKRKFDRYLEDAMRTLRADLAQAWVERVREAKDDLPAYEKQLSILAYLEPGPYGETRVPLSLSQTQIGVIYQGRYYLLPVCEPGFMRPPSATIIRAQLAGVFYNTPTTSPTDLTPLAGRKRAALAALRPRFTAPLVRDLTALRFAPILLNFDFRPRSLPLSELRQAERGVGDHPLTIFDTGESFVFDQSHIFFDGAWGAALAEIITNEALAWAVYLSKFPAPAPSSSVPKPLALQVTPDDALLLKDAPRAMPEVGVASTGLQLKPLQALRRLFQYRSEHLQVTVNDLLVLYRAIHAVTYLPDPALVAAIDTLADADAQRLAKEALAEASVNPAILIPVDASLRNPRDRVHPMSIEVPLREFDFINLHKQAMDALWAYQNAPGDRAKLYTEFDDLQRRYLTVLAGLGLWLNQSKEFAILGQSSSVSSIKMLAHLPPSMQRMLDRLPGQFDVLNDLIKGREVFSNVGAVVRDSTLRRFSSAKDDNDKKTLVWGVITDAAGVMHMTLRDFRPHVGRLEALGRRDLALRIAQEYLDAYVRGFNAFVQDLHHITQFSRETQLERQAGL